MVRRINSVLLHERHLESIDFVVIHNDAGRKTPEDYVIWLKNRDKTLGIAHYYINRHTIAQVIPTYSIGYHTGDWASNTRSIGYEVCESLSATDDMFIENENMALMQATEDLLFYKLPINEQTVRLHHEFVPTTCPHRSMALHGNTTSEVKRYFIEKMKYFATLGTTVEEMLGSVAEDSSVHKQTIKKTDEEIVQEILRGQWGNGVERKRRLNSAGYDATVIQKLVNKTIMIAEKSIEDVAKEVIKGDWGNGDDRKNRLQAAGYKYETVQSKVNELLA